MPTQDSRLPQEANSLSPELQQMQEEVAAILTQPEIARMVGDDIQIFASILPDLVSDIAVQVETALRHIRRRQLTDDERSHVVEWCAFHLSHEFYHRFLVALRHEDSQRKEDSTTDVAVTGGLSESDQSLSD